eukprot:5483056-Pleurochrysis_carterae.AAC.1
MPLAFEYAVPGRIENRSTLIRGERCNVAMRYYEHGHADRAIFSSETEAYLNLHNSQTSEHEPGVQGQYRSA